MFLDMLRTDVYADADADADANTDADAKTDAHTFDVAVTSEMFIFFADKLTIHRQEQQHQHIHSLSLLFFLLHARMKCRAKKVRNMIYMCAYTYICICIYI